MILLVLLPVFVVLGVKRVRRSRRLRTAGRDRVLGAWAELRDHLREANVPIFADMSRRQIAQIARDDLGAGAGTIVASLAASADRAGFSTPIPHDRADAGAVADLADFEAEFGSTRGRWRRFRCRVSVRPLRAWLVSRPRVEEPSVAATGAESRQ
ncbi:MAG TPA: hypothetical protein VGI86_08665 [Acidimicrobiia bacterium]